MIPIEVKVIRRTEKALLLLVWDSREEWVPASQVYDGVLIKEGYEGTLRVSQRIPADAGMNRANC